MLTRELEETLSFAVDRGRKAQARICDARASAVCFARGQLARAIFFSIAGHGSRSSASSLEDYFETCSKKCRTAAKHMPELTSTFQSTIQYAVLQAEGSGQSAVDGGNILAALYQAEQSYAVYLLLQQGVTRLDILNYISHGISKIDAGEPLPEGFDEDEFGGLAACRSARSRLRALRSNLSHVPPRARSTRSSAARPRSNARFRSFAAERRTIRSTLANPASAKRRWPRAWR